MATYRTLHLASLAAPPLRGGLTPASAQRSAKHLRTLLGVEALAITDRVEVLAWDGIGERHGQAALAHAALGPGVGSGRGADRRPGQGGLGDPAQRGRRTADLRRRRDRRTRGLLGPAAGPGDGPRGGGGGGVRLRPARPRRAGPDPGPLGRGRGARAARPDLAALRLQLADRDRLVRAHRPRPCPRPAARLRRLHPLQLPLPRPVHDPGRGAALDRAVPAAGAGPVRRPADGGPAGGPGGRRASGSPSCASSPWWRTPCATASRTPTDPGRSRSPRGTAVRTA